MPRQVALKKAMTADVVKTSLRGNESFRKRVIAAFSWTLAGEPLRAQPLLDPEANALSPFNPQLIKTPWE